MLASVRQLIGRPGSAKCVTLIFCASDSGKKISDLKRFNTFGNHIDTQCRTEGDDTFCDCDIARIDQDVFDEGLIRM